MIEGSKQEYYYNIKKISNSLESIANSLEILAIRTTISEIESKREETPDTVNSGDNATDTDTTEDISGDFFETRFLDAMDSYDNSDYDGDS